MALPQHDRILISQVPVTASMRITFNGKFFGKYDMIIDMQSNGVSCAICKREIEEDIFYCEQDNIFMHKQCLIDKHRLCDNASIVEMQNRNESTFHEDRAVDVRFTVDCANKGYTDEDGQWFEKKPEYPDRDETPADDLN